MCQTLPTTHIKPRLENHNEFDYFVPLPEVQLLKVVEIPRCLLNVMIKVEHILYFVPCVITEVQLTEHLLRETQWYPRETVQSVNFFLCVEIKVEYHEIWFLLGICNRSPKVARWQMILVTWTIENNATVEEVAAALVVEKWPPLRAVCLPTNSQFNVPQCLLSRTQFDFSDDRTTNYGRRVFHQKDGCCFNQFDILTAWNQPRWLQDTSPFPQIDIWCFYSLGMCLLRFWTVMVLRG